LAEQSLMPEGLEGKRFYEPTDRGFEAELRRRLEQIRRHVGESQ
jgi:putative ATPase